MSTATYPDTYLHIYECRGGEEHIIPLTDETPLDLEALVSEWIDNTYCGECVLDGEIMPRLEGDYYAKIMMDGRAPDSPICWTGGGFYIQPA